MLGSVVITFPSFSPIVTVLVLPEATDIALDVADVKLPPVIVTLPFHLNQYLLQLLSFLTYHQKS